LAQEEDGMNEGSDGIDGPEALEMAFICQQCKQPLQVSYNGLLALYSIHNTAI
jgi:hypothetical protein